MIEIPGMEMPVSPAMVGSVMLVNCIKTELANLLTQRGMPPSLAAAACKVGKERSIEIFNNAYDEHATRMSGLFDLNYLFLNENKSSSIRTTVVGSYPFPAWLEHASQHLTSFGKTDVDEMIEGCCAGCYSDQIASGLDVITDGEQTRLDFNLSFYGFIHGIERETISPRR